MGLSSPRNECAILLKLKIEYLWRSLRSVNLIPIKVSFPAACCDKISFALHDTPFKFLDSLKDLTIEQIFPILFISAWPEIVRAKCFRRNSKNFD